MKLLIKILAFALLFVFCKEAKCQDPQYSQFELNPLYQNPAFAGAASDLRVGINYRNHWPNIPGKTFPGPFSTYNVYGDKQFNNALVGGVGLIAMQSFKGEGFLRFTSVGGIYSWHMPTKTKNFNMYFGTGVYFSQIAVDWSRFRFSDQVSSEGYLDKPSAFTPQGSGKRAFVDISAGTVARFNIAKKWSNEISFSTIHLSRPDISLEGIETRLPFRFSVLYNTSLSIREGKLYLNPRFLFEKQDVFTGFTSGLNFYVTRKYFLNQQFHYDKIMYLGFIFRNSRINEGSNTKALVFTIGHTGHFGNNNTRYQVGLSYDFTIGGLNQTTYGALELSATMIFYTKNSIRRSQKCVNFQGNPLGPIN
ncbi:MAG: PorP/SprF family type IX secretion system membrane protein [Chitinophagales bacterium]|nr:PorP/SprF family type IX secretion system membrane protein [Chitinophagales bacterium]